MPLAGADREADTMKQVWRSSLGEAQTVLDGLRYRRATDGLGWGKLTEWE